MVGRPVPAVPGQARRARRAGIAIGIALGVASASAGLAGAAAAQTRAELQNCLGNIAPSLTSQRLSLRQYRMLTAKLEPDATVLEKLDFQPEFVRPVWSYLATLVDDERIQRGQERLASEASLLRTIEQQYGVSATVVLAIWGVETDFGRNLGTRPLLRSLATLSCFGRRQTFFRQELGAALTIVADGDIAASELQGSWAGAFGHTQFMPSTFIRTAVDFDQDGKRDLIHTLGDAFASTAAYLGKAGWQTGQPWGFEVALPDSLIAHADGRTDRKPLAHWRAANVRAVDPSRQASLDALPPDTRAAVVRPAGNGGPAFLILRNFDAVHAFNPSINYALAVLHLADRIEGGPAFITPWPAVDTSLNRTQSVELQEILVARGHDIGPIDGILGPASRSGIRAEQRRLGLPETGFADQSLLQKLRGVQ